MPVEDVPGFTVTDSEGSSTKTAEDANLIFSTDDRGPDYEFEIKAGTGEGSPPLTPMLVTPTVGTNIKEIVVKIFPKDTTINPKEVVVRIYLKEHISATRSPFHLQISGNRRNWTWQSLEMCQKTLASKAAAHLKGMTGSGPSLVPEI